MHDHAKKVIFFPFPHCSVNFMVTLFCSVPSVGSEIFFSYFCISIVNFKPVLISFLLSAFLGHYLLWSKSLELSFFYCRAKIIHTFPYLHNFCPPKVQKKLMAQCFYHVHYHPNLYSLFWNSSEQSLHSVPQSGPVFFMASSITFFAFLQSEWSRPN